LGRADSDTLIYAFTRILYQLGSCPWAVFLTTGFSPWEKKSTQVHTSTCIHSYTCIRMHTHTHTYANTHTYSRACTHTHTCTHTTHTHTCTHTHARTHTHTHTLSLSLTHTHTRTHKHTHAFTCTRKYTHTHTHTYAHTRSRSLLLSWILGFLSRAPAFTHTHTRTPYIKTSALTKKCRASDKFMRMHALKRTPTHHTHSLYHFSLSLSSHAHAISHTHTHSLSCSVAHSLSCVPFHTHRWRSINPNLRRGKFQPEEDLALLSAVEKFTVNTSKSNTSLENDGEEEGVGGVRGGVKIDWQAVMGDWPFCRRKDQLKTRYQVFANVYTCIYIHVYICIYVHIFICVYIY